jgi:crossover junction endodeoxyribonuclease RusA
VVVNYSQGRRRGLTDEETEDRALKAVSLAMEILARAGGCKMIEFVVPGRPVPKARPRLGVRGRKAFIYTPPATREYEKLVGWVARCAGCKPLNGPLAVKLHLFIRGRSGDVDNYCKSILDGLNGVAYEDDDQVVELLVRKHRVKAAADERVEIEIREAG